MSCLPSFVIHTAVNPSNGGGEKTLGIFFKRAMRLITSVYLITRTKSLFSSNSFTELSGGEIRSISLVPQCIYWYLNADADKVPCVK